MIGIVGIILTVVQFVTAITVAQEVGWFTGICFGLFAYICLVLAKGKREAWLYLPFLIIGVCLFIFLPKFGLLVVITLQYDHINKLCSQSYISGDLPICCAWRHGTMI